MEKIWSAAEIRQGIQDGYRFALPYEIRRAKEQVESIQSLQNNVSKHISEAMEQSSETWHDNAPADALFAEMFLLDTKESGLVQAQKHLVEVSYPAPDIKYVAIGSRVLILEHGDESYIDITGNLPLSNDVTDHDGVERGSVAAPMPQALLGALPESIVTVDVAGGRSFEVRVLEIDQDAQQIAYDA